MFRLFCLFILVGQIIIGMLIIFNDLPALEVAMNFLSAGIVLMIIARDGT